MPLLRLLRRPFLFTRSLSQALVETWLIGIPLWLIIIGVQLSLHLTAAVWEQWSQSYYINLLLLSWFLLRIAPPRPLWSKGLLKQLGASLLVLLPLHAIFVFSMYLLSSSASSTPGVDRPNAVVTIGVIITLFWLLLFTGITFFLQFWNRLRQRSLHWTLINAHLILLIVLGAIYLTILSFTTSKLPPFNFLFLSTAFFFLILLLMLMVPLMLFVMPPLALFAYFVTQPTVRRVKALVATTNRLREGHYTERAPVEGQDEIAQLQTNFNAMADELEKTIRALRTERDHVESLLKERRELFANVSHELRTPIATLRGYLESDLKNRNQLPESALWDDLAVMEREVLQLQERADELFNLSKAEVAQVRLQHAPCDIGQLVQTLVDSYAPLAWRTSKVEVVADIPDDVPLVSADQSHLEQALKNIMRNAQRHTPPGGVIALVVSVEAERVGIAIEDTGEGIAPEDLEHIWERFYQAGTTRQQGGAGIGLSLVKEWITDMGGSVAATSTPGEGSCFTLYLPRL